MVIVVKEYKEGEGDQENKAEKEMENKMKNQRRQKDIHWLGHTVLRRSSVHGPHGGQPQDHH